MEQQTINKLDKMELNHAYIMELEDGKELSLVCFDISKDFCYLAPYKLNRQKDGSYELKVLCEEEVVIICNSEERNLGRVTSFCKYISDDTSINNGLKY